jgi:membrane protein DedA with SNARE-associated domain
MTLTTCLGIALATLLAEDATAVGVGVAIQSGAFPAIPGILACAAGIYVGDVGLWAAGRIGGPRLLRWRPFARLSAPTLTTLGAWVDRNPAAAILGSRFLPGTRLPLYVAAGMGGTRPWRFLGWMLVAVALWTPLIVLVTAFAGDAVLSPLQAWLGAGWAARLAGTALILVGFHAGLAVGTPRGRARIAARLARLRRWEFWPAWAVNAPVAVWIACLAVRHRGLTVFTAANPGIEDGGVVGESKSRILARLPREYVLPWALLEAGPLETRMACLRAAVRSLGTPYPFVLKPDVGERGAGVRWVWCEAEARAYLSDETGPVLMQVAHEGPFEAGLFYVREPHADAGHVFSVTDKRFPVLVGDGRSTLEALVRAHPRYRLQADVFLQRHAARRDRVPAAGERVQLARAGNHAQGTEFVDGRALLTPALEARVDIIARRFDGFFFGRFDVRYRDRGAFMAGEDFSIVELNGVTSEATHIYDSAHSVWVGWRTLMQQWSLAFAIGAANRARGHQPTPVRRLVRLVWRFARTRQTRRIAD